MRSVLSVNAFVGAQGGSCGAGNAEAGSAGPCRREAQKTPGGRSPADWLCRRSRGIGCRGSVDGRIGRSFGSNGFSGTVEQFAARDG